MYILPSTDKETLIVVSQGRAVGKAIKQSLIAKGAKHYFVIHSESEEPKEKLSLAN
jgi:5,10-methylene-tetrahydrofolate dehydrogenase/methenyl tetrahydrofolate cyclohydrolase